MSRGIFRIKPKLMPYVSDVNEYLQTTLGDSYKSDIILSTALAEPGKALKEIQIASKGLVAAIGTLVESIITSKQFLSLFGYDDEDELGGKAFNNDKAELIKNIYVIIDRLTKKDAPYDIPKLLMEKMKKVNFKGPGPEPETE